MLSKKDRLNFICERLYPDKVSSVSSNMMAAAGILRGRGVYSFLGMELGRKDMKNALILKRMLDETPGTKDSTLRWESRVARAKALAIRMAGEKGIIRNVEKISYIAAHYAAGYGIISMLLDDHNVNEADLYGRHSIVKHSSLGECRTNVSFRDIEGAGEAISAIERDSQMQPDGIVVEASLDKRSLSAKRHSRKASPSSFINGGFVSDGELAYLWMAIESDMNIVVAGSNEGAGRLLHAAGMLIQRSKRIIAVAGGCTQLGLNPGPNTIVCGSLDGKEELDADRLMISGLDKGNATAFFRRAMLGQPMIAGVGDDSFPSMLSSVDEALLSRLDIYVSARTPRKVDSIAEYMWFANGEVEERDCANPSEPSLLQVSSNGALNRKSLNFSKALHRYSKKYAVSLEDAIKELEKRAKFLGRCTDTSTEDYWALQKLK